MAETTLRAYLQEVDDLIEHEQLDEAIAHCRHILQTYPKHLESYRLLGKGYLEAKRYGDAADLFQRVLSAIPDDFVSHIGMSIVREDEGNLDASIWHMERAFETNPANPAIQQELRRLIGRRDGLEPHKVRLTRGALARMYAHGELYPQAIAELRSALHEDPDRPDLQTLLAEMYWRTDQKVEAAEVCSRILEKLPFCRDALRIMASVLQATGKVDEAAIYHRRLAALDPYTAFLESAVGDPKSVDAGSVRIEKLAWRPGQPVPSAEPSRPQWTPAQPAPAAEEAMPAWLRSLEQPQPSTPPSATAIPTAEAERPAERGPEPVAAPPPGADIPEWMRDAGWTESTGAAIEGPVSFTDEEVAGTGAGEAVVPETTLQPADIPDWLQDMAPSPEAAKYSAEPDTRPAPVPASSGLPDWLGEFAAEEGQDVGMAEEAPGAGARPASSGTFDEAFASAPAAAEGAEVPTWLSTPADGASETIVTWLGRRGEEPAQREAGQGPEVAGAPPEDELPSWISKMPSTGAAEPAPPSKPPMEELPSWLSGVAQAASQDSGLKESDLESIRSTLDESAMVEMPEEEIPAPPMARAEAPDWLRQLSGQEPSEPGVPAAKIEAEETQTPPSWTEGSREAGAEIRARSQEALPDWLEGIGEPGPSLGEPAASEEPEWLRGIGEAEAPPTPVAADDWLSASRDTAGATPETAPEETPTVPGIQMGPATEAGEPAQELPEPPAWLRGAPSQEVADLAGEAEIMGPPVEPAPPAEEVPIGEPAEWLREFGDAGQAETPGEELAAAEVPDWLKEFGGVEEASPGEPAEEAEFEGALGWLQETASEVSPDPMQGLGEPTSAAMAEGLATTADVAASEAMGEEDVMRWLEDLAARQTQGPTIAEPPLAEAVPAASAAATFAAAPPPDQAEESMEWLEKLAAETTSGPAASVQPAAGVPPAPPAEEEVFDTEWMSAMAATPPPVDATTAEPAPPEAVGAEPVFQPDETLPGRPRPTFAARGATEKPPGTTPLTESEVIEWLQKTATAAQTARGEAPARARAAAEALPEEVDQATEFAIQLLMAGRAAMEAGDIQAAVQAYGPVIQRGLLLNSVLEDLKQAVTQKPDATPLWQCLGDAYKKANMLPEALKAYSRAMKEEDGLELARQALQLGDLALAVMHYGSLIKRKEHLEDVIADLRSAVDAEPRRPALWQALGDAFMKANRLTDAIEAYRRGMESV